MNSKKILVAVDSFKGCFSSVEAGDIIKEVLVSEGFTNISVMGVSDGGDGFTEAVSALHGAVVKKVNVKGPFFYEVPAKYVLFGDTAVIESAQACGIVYGLDVMNSTTYGVGQMIDDAVANGAKHIVLGLGGSATNDGGSGMLCALGAVFNKKHPFIPAGRTLCNITDADFSAVSEKMKDIDVLGCCDVNAVFNGKNGAAYRFAKQKGASSEEIKRLDSGLEHLSRYYKKGISDIAGTGAAGGLGGAILMLPKGKLESGFKLFARLSDLENAISSADIVITGEGKTDARSAEGKLPSGIALTCKTYNKPCYIICGCTDGDISTLNEYGVLKVFPSYDKPQKQIEKADAVLHLMKAASAFAEAIR